MSEETYSVQLRIRRVTYEDAYVAVPVTTKITKERADGTFGIIAEALLAEGLRLSEDPRVEWVLESRANEPHPVQIAMPSERKQFDGFYEGDV